MPNFFVALKVKSLEGDIHEGNCVMQTLTEIPAITDFEGVKVKYCQGLLDNNVKALPGHTMITMCVPCIFDFQ